MPREENGEKAAWVAEYHDQYGKRHSKTFATKEAALAWLSEAQEADEDGWFPSAVTSLYRARSPRPRPGTLAVWAWLDRQSQAKLAKRAKFNLVQDYRVAHPTDKRSDRQIERAIEAWPKKAQRPD